MKLKEMNQNPEIIVLVGVPGSGKSTFVKKKLSQTQVPYVVLSSDNEIEKLAAEEGMNYTEGFKKFVGQATAIVKQKFRDAVDNNENIIWDQTNLTPKKRTAILNQLPSNYRKIAVAFEVDGDELKNRLSKREKETGKHIPDFVMKDMNNNYQPPSKSEGFDEVYFM